MNRSTVLIVVASLVMAASPVVGEEKLKVFILAGQSNTVGHARGHTIATLYKSGKSGDRKLTEMVFGKSNAIEEAMDEQLAKFVAASQAATTG